MKVAMPSAIILALQLDYSGERFLLGMKTLGLVMVSYLFMIVLSKGLSRFFKLEAARQDILEVATILPNTSFMGYPIVAAVLGKEALFFAVLGAGLAFETVAWSYGIYNISRRTEFDFRENMLRNIVLSPGILSILTGLILFFFSIRIPEPINSTMHILGQASSPLAMLLVGILLSRSSIRQCLFNYKLYLIGLMKLLVFPGLVLLALSGLGFRGLQLIVPVVMLSMPTAAYIAMFSQNTGNDASFASQIVFISCLMSLFTIPLMVSLVSSI